MKLHGCTSYFNQFLLNTGKSIKICQKRVGTSISPLILCNPLKPKKGSQGQEEISVNHEKALLILTYKCWSFDVSGPLPRLSPHPSNNTAPIHSVQVPKSSGSYQCGLKGPKHSFKIAGGNYAHNGEWPWMARLALHGSNSACHGSGPCSKYKKSDPISTHTPTSIVIFVHL